MSQNDTKPSIRKRVAEFILYALFVFCDAWEFWGVSHLACLAIATVGLLALLVYDGMPTRCVAVLFMIGLISCSGIYAFAPPILPPQTDTHGWLMPGNEATPPNACTGGQFGNPPQRGLLFIAGTNGAWTLGDYAQILSIGQKTFFSIERNENGLAIDADIFDQNGDLVARIEKNEFHLVPGKMAYQERDGLNKLTVYGPKGDPILFVDYANPHAVLIRGIFVTENGSEIIIDNKKITDQTGTMNISGNCAGIGSINEPLFVF